MYESNGIYTQLCKYEQQNQSTLSQCYCSSRVAGAKAVVTALPNRWDGATERIFLVSSLAAYHLWTWTTSDGFWGPVRISPAACRCAQQYLALEVAAACKCLLLFVSPAVNLLSLLSLYLAIQQAKLETSTWFLGTRGSLTSVMYWSFFKSKKCFFKIVCEEVKSELKIRPA